MVLLNQVRGNEDKFYICYLIRCREQRKRGFFKSSDVRKLQIVNFYDLGEVYVKEINVFDVYVQLFILR